MNAKLRRADFLLIGVGVSCLLIALVALQFAPVFAYHEGVELPADYRYWYHVGSKSISPEAATALGLPPEIFGNTFDAVFANDAALNDLRSGNRPFSDGATFVAPFFTLTHPLEGLDAQGNLAFTAVMVKNSEHFADTGGWGFEAFAPDGTALTDLQASCFECHTAQAENDFVFSTLTERAISAVPASENGVFLPIDYRSMYYRGSKVIRTDAAAALGLPDIFANTVDAVYVNHEALNALRNEVRPFPVGSMFVAEFNTIVAPIEGLAAHGDVAFTAVMLKGPAGTGDDPSTGDWRFQAFDADGTPILGDACAACHATQSANDFVFSGG